MSRNTSSIAFWRNTTLPFDNAVLRELPVDKNEPNRVRSAVPRACFARVKPTPVKNPELVIVSRDALKLASIDVWKTKQEAETEVSASSPPSSPSSSSPKDQVAPIDTLTPFLSGNQLFPGSEPAAQCYCGHQFGYFSGQLGDGAAIYLGEVVRNKAINDRWELQLKGAGLTPFSRQADGRKVLRSTLREFLASEHMHALRIPTTRAGSVAMSRETQVVRDVFYDGNAKEEPTAVVLRIARTFLRFGSFEIFKPTDPQTGRAGPSAYLDDKDQLMRQMLDFTVRQYFPVIWQEEKTEQARYKRFFDEVVRRTASLVAKWQAVGFCHGVLNTDNMSIVGDTLDYGPYGFMEFFNPKHICNTSDDTGRYRYEAQPEICKWNCSVLADQLEMVVKREDLDEGLAKFDDTYQQEYYRIMRQKMGLIHKSLPDDKLLIDSLFDVLAKTGADFTCTFRCLIDIRAFHEESHTNALHKLVEFSENLDQVKRKHSNFTDAQYEMVKALLMKNPAQARMYGITEEMLDKMTEERETLAELNKSTNGEHRGKLRATWSPWIDHYVQRLKEETDFTPDVAHEMHRQNEMRRVNPIYVLRNHVAQKAIDYALNGEYDKVEHIFNLLTHPFKEGTTGDIVYARPQNPSTSPLCVSCSS